MKKLLAIVMAVCLLFTLGGCTSTESNLYKTMKEMAGLTDYSFEGDLAVTINKLNIPMKRKEGMPSAPEDYVKLLNGSHILYRGTMDSQKKTLTFALDMKKADGTLIKILDMSAESHYVYVLEKPIQDLLGAAYDPDNKELVIETRDGNRCIVFDMEDLVDDCIDRIENEIEGAYPERSDPEGKTTEYMNGYNDSFNNACKDVRLGTTPSNPEYDDQYLGYLTPDNQAEYKAGYADGYEVGKTAAEKEQAADEAALANLKDYRKQMMANANAQYLTGLIKSIGVKGMDCAVDNAFSGTALGIVKKVGDSGYSLHLDNSSLPSLVKTFGDYLPENASLIAEACAAFLKSLSKEELLLLGLYPDAVDEYAKTVSEHVGEYLEHLSSRKSGSSNEDKSEPEEAMFKDLPTFSYDFALTKRGSSSFETVDSFSCKYVPKVVAAALENEDDEDDTHIPEIDFSLANTMTVNAAGAGNNKTDPAVKDAKASGSSLTLTLSDPAAIDCGILYSTSADMSNPVKLEGSKQADGTYLVSLPGLAVGNVYYRTYTVDGASNLLVSSKVYSFQATSAPVDNNSNPKTGEASTAAVLLMTAGLAALALSITKARRSKTSR